ncbi:MAG TPA: DUF1559 domain-containing protein, partial [Isosphaeraceae bacterium]|nr:DUF1559 domain-containing protein [Isosphaeraceae bacterium]
PPKAARETMRKGTRSITALGKGDAAIAIWDEQGDTVICEVEHIDHILAVLDRKEPSALAHPIRIELLKPEGRLLPVGLAFIDLTLTKPPADAAKLGLDGIKRIDMRWGFHDEALSTVYRLIAPAPRQGVPALFDQPTFEKGNLPPLPAGVTNFSVVSVDAAKLYDQIIALMKTSGPDGVKKAADSEAALRQALGIDPRQELFPHLASDLAIYSWPMKNAPGVETPPFTDLTLRWELRNSGAVTKAIDKLMPALNAQLAARGQKAQGPQGAPVPQFARVNAARPTYMLSFPEGAVPQGPMASFQPTVIVGQDQLIIAARGDTAAAALALTEQGQNPFSGPAQKRWTPAGAFASMTRLLPSNLIFLNVSDPRETLPALFGNLPTFLQGVNIGIAQAQAKSQKPGQAAGPPFALRADPAKIPSAKDLSSRLFPASTAVSIDRQGLRIAVREPIPSISSPGSTAVMVALLLPAVQAAREAARRAQCVNNLKQLGLAMHNYEASHAGFPKAAITDKQGKPILSWRVALLPFLDQQSLYDKFKLDEPWDSPANKPLVSEMPSVFTCPSLPRPEPGTTCYRVFVGNGALLETTDRVKIAQITDGTANTLAVVESKVAVPWTKPDELAFDPAGQTPLFGVGSAHPGGFNALFADGSVRFLKNVIDLKTLAGFITRAGGEKPPAPDAQP